MRTLAVALAVTVLTSSLSRGQENPSARENSLSPGEWAILFEIAEDLDSHYEDYPEDNARFAPYDGLAVMLKHMTSEKWGYRVGVLVNNRVVDERVSDSYNFDFLLQGVRHVASQRQVSPFIAAGATFGHTGVKDSTDLRVGLAFTLGAEYFPIRWLSILGEYNSSLLYRSKDVKIETWDDDGEHGWTTPPHRLKSLEFAPTAVRLGVSLYW